MNTQKLIMLLSLSLLIASCKDDEPYVSFTINSIDYVTPTSAVVSLIATDISSGLAAYYCGIYVCTDYNTSDGFHILGGSNLSLDYEFKTGLSDLSPDTRYIIAAYAETEEGILYGDTLSFRTKSVDFLTDERDNQQYMIQQYGDDVWMIENLNYYTDSSFYYNDDSINYSDFGCLYTYSKAENACPIGWHLPTRNEWNNLINTIANENGIIEDSIAPYMLAPGMRYWEDNDANDFTNSSYFSILPTGIGKLTDTTNYYYDYGFRTMVWSARDSGKTYNRCFAYFDFRAFEFTMTPNDIYLYSIRCVKD